MGEVTPTIILSTDFTPGTNVILHPPTKGWAADGTVYRPNIWYQTLEIDDIKLKGEYFVSTDAPLTEYIQTRIAPLSRLDACVPPSAGWGLYQEVSRIDTQTDTLSRNQFLLDRIEQSSNYRHEFYWKVRMKFQPDLVKNMDIDLPWSPWRTITSFHKGTGVSNNLALGLHYVAAESRVAFILEKSKSYQWRETSSESAPAGEWFTLEFWARPETSQGSGDGLVAVALDGEIVLQKTTDLYYGTSGLGRWSVLKCYTDVESIRVGQAYQWTDSIEIWHGWPTDPTA